MRVTRLKTEERKDEITGRKSWTVGRMDEIEDL